MKKFSTFCLLSGFMLAFSGCDQKKASGDAGANQIPDVASHEDFTIYSESPDDAPVKILIVDDKSEWESEIKDVQAVLDGTAQELVKHFPDRDLEAIAVRPKGGPVVFYQRDLDGEYTVELNTGKRLWAQCTFQFAHEMTHILANYTEDKNPNGWFEESLCEAGSLYVLRAMAKTWETNPPYKNWRDYSVELTKYAQKRIDEANLLARAPLAEWYAGKKTALRLSSTNRDLNNIVAVKLLPLFEEHPESWEAISWLNVEKSYPEDTFEEYLKRWHYYVPERHREFVEKVASEFGIAFE